MAVQLYTTCTAVQLYSRHISIKNRQSPINIRLADTVFDHKLSAKPLALRYPKEIQETALLQNTGQTWKVIVSDSRFRKSL